MDKENNHPSWVAIPSLENWLLQEQQLSSKVAILEQLAGPHIAWYTHKNPFACWICDYIVVCRRLLQLVEEIRISTTKSSLDFMNESDGGKDCDNK